MYVVLDCFVVSYIDMGLIEDDEFVSIYRCSVMIFFVLFDDNEDVYVVVRRLLVN